MPEMRSHRTLRYHAEFCVRSLRVGLLTRGFRGSSEPSSPPSVLPQAQPSLSGKVEGSFPHTVAGPRRLFTGFPVYALAGTRGDQQIFRSAHLSLPTTIAAHNQCQTRGPVATANMNRNPRRLRAIPTIPAKSSGTGPSVSSETGLSATPPPKVQLAGQSHLTRRSWSPNSTSTLRSKDTSTRVGHRVSPGSSWSRRWLG